MVVRKAKPMEELLKDKGFAFHIGQLIGAAEMTAFQLQLMDDENAKNVGSKLAEVVNWFFVEEKVVDYKR